MMRQHVVYRVRDWDDHFENNRTRELKRLAWVPMPVKHDGDGYTQLVDHRQGAAHFGAWCAIVEVAAKCDPRGTLLRDGGRPHDAASLARVTRLDRKTFDAVLPRLVSIGWLETYEISQEDAGISQVPAQKGREQKGREQKGREQNEGVAAVIAHYREYHPNARPGAKERAKIRDRLGDGYSVADLQAAIDGCHRSPHHCGLNDRNTKYQALELIVRDSSKVQQFMEVPESPRLLGKGDERNIRNQMAGERWLKEHEEDPDEGDRPPRIS